MLFEYISFFLLVFTSLVGIFSIVKMITEWIYNDSSSLSSISVLPLKEHNDLSEMLLRSFFAKNEGNIIVVDLGLDDEMLKIVYSLKGKRDNVAIIKDYELQDSLEQIFKERKQSLQD